MKDIIMITAEDIKDYAPISAAIDPQLLEPFLPLAQSFHLRPVLGTSLYNDIITQISGDTISEANFELLNDYIRPMLVWYAYYEALPFIWSRTNAKGITKGFSDTTESLDKKEFELLKQEILDKAVAFKNLMIDFLIQSDDYETFKAEGSRTKSNSSGIYLGNSYIDC